VLGALEGDGTNLTAVRDQHRLLARDVVEKAPDSCQPCVAGPRRTAPLLLAFIEKPQHPFLRDVFDRQLIDRYFHGVGDITQKQFDGIAVSQDGIDRKAFLGNVPTSLT
jgi:hypothetical protein